MIRWTAQGLSDLEHLHDYIAKDNHDAAVRTVEIILRGLASLETFPEAGRKGARVKGTRELVVYPYLIVYRVKGGWIEVLAVIHGSRKWPDR
jgi:addiction module RelE/StbE family toxin